MDKHFLVKGGIHHGKLFRTIKVDNDDKFTHVSDGWGKWIKLEPDYYYTHKNPNWIKLDGNEFYILLTASSTGLLDGVYVCTDGCYGGLTKQIYEADPTYNPYHEPLAPLDNKITGVCNIL